MRILICEDETNIQEILSDFLTAEGYEVHIASNAAEGLRLFAAEEPDLVLLDLMLPEMDGFETCRQLKNRVEKIGGNGRNGRKLPIIMITALDSDDCRRLGLEAGADAYFTKPFDPDEIIATIRNLIEK